MIKKKVKPYFYINGHNFHVDVNSRSKTKLNITKTEMYVPKNKWGYTDVSWNNFLGEDLDLTIYSRTNETYRGDRAQPNDGSGIWDFYNTPRTPHAVLKYWAQNGVECIVNTNIQSHENGAYIIDDGMTQTNPTDNFVITDLTLVLNEKPSEVNQTYYQTDTAGINNNSFTGGLSALAYQVSPLKEHGQECLCTRNTPQSQCTAPQNEEVQVIQSFLQRWGYIPREQNGIPVAVSGRFCWNTKAALQLYQQHNGLAITGKFNKQTRDNFVRRLSKVS